MRTTNETNGNSKVVYEVQAMKDGKVFKSETFVDKDNALNAMYEFALEAKAVGGFKSMKNFKDKKGVYGYEIKNKTNIYQTIMVSKVVKA